LAIYKIKKLDNENDINEAKKYFIELNKIGLFDSYPSEWYDLVCDIQKFIK